MIEDIFRQSQALPTPLLVALDVDGTLAPIVDRPDQATIPKTTLQVLETLCASPEIVLALITGRDYDALKAMAPNLAAWRATQHGRFVFAPNESPSKSRLNDSKSIDEFERWLKKNLAEALLEKKPGTIAVHVRELQDDPLLAKIILEKAATEGKNRGLSLRHGRAMCEFETEPGDKATALKSIFEKCGAESTLYAGDDLTDFAAIEFAASRGIGVFVASVERPQGPAKATYKIEGPIKLAKLLARLSRASVGTSSASW